MLAFVTYMFGVLVVTGAAVAPIAFAGAALSDASK
jgi:hypothetical protein